MRYLSIDLEATGLDQHCLIIEFAAVPFDTEGEIIFENEKFHVYVRCPSFEELSPQLDPWVREHNERLIKKAHADGVALEQFKRQFISYLESPAIQSFFKNQKIILFGKSMNAIDLPFLHRDLGESFMRRFFNHRTLDLSSVVYHMINLKIIPEECESGSKLMTFLGMGDVCHTAYEDAVNTASMYLKLMELSKA